MARTIANCVLCGTPHLPSEMYFAPVLNRGGKPSYICNSCRDRQANYTSGTSPKGKVKSEHWTASMELETSAHTATGTANLQLQGFLPSPDVSIRGNRPVEFKSAIYQGFGGLVKYCKSIDKLLDAGEIEINDTCGHHLHIGRTDIVNHLTGDIYDIDCHSLDALWKYADEILNPVSDYLEANPHVSIQLFGRTMHPQWAANLHQAVYVHGCGNRYLRAHENRYCFFNFCTEGKIPGQRNGKSPEYAKTIEFRLNFYRNAEQYGKLIMLEKKIVNAMIANFLDYWNAGDSDTNLKRQAMKTGKKIVTLISKTYWEN